VPSGITGRHKAVSKDFKANENGGQQDRHPAGQGHVTLECGTIVHHHFVPP
jgi:hypothetical protein